MSLAFQRVDLVQGSPEWHALRMTKLTASQAPALFGLSPYQTELQLWDEKLTGTVRDESEKQVLFERGHSVEKAAREWMKSNLNLDLTPSVLVSEKTPDLMASLDGDAIQTHGLIFESKYVGRETLQLIRKKQLPAHHECQVQAQLYVSGAEKCLYFAMDPDGEATIEEIRPSKQWLTDIPPAAVEFMRKVRTGEAPTATERDIFKSEDPRFATLARLYVNMKYAQAEYDNLEELLLKEYEQHGRIKAGPVSVTRYFAKGNVDYSKIPQLKGVDLDRFRKAGSLRTRVTIKE